MLSELKDFVKTIGIGEHFSIGKIDSAKDKSIGVYGDSNRERVEAIGRESSYDRANARILIHWTKNLRETEAAARELFEALRYIHNVQMGDVFVYFLDLTQGEPAFVGTDDNGIYEYVITLSILYRR